MLLFLILVSYIAVSPLYQFSGRLAHIAPQMSKLREVSGRHADTFERVNRYHVDYPCLCAIRAEEGTRSALPEKLFLTALQWTLFCLIPILIVELAIEAVSDFR